MAAQLAAAALAAAAAAVLPAAWAGWPFAPAALLPSASTALLWVPQPVVLTAKRMVPTPAAYLPGITVFRQAQRTEAGAVRSRAPVRFEVQGYYNGT